MNDFIVNGLFCLLGIIATVIVGKWGIKKKVITNYCTNKFSIGKELKNEFGKLEILYENKTITNELRVYKGVIMNTGNEDIDNIPESGIIMKCPNNWLIKDRIIVNHSKNIKISCERGRDDTETRFKPDMLKKGEAFSYSILYEIIENESKPKKEVENDIEFFDRIKDTKFRKEYMPLSGSSNNKRMLRLYLFIACNILLFIGSIYLVPSKQAINVIENETGETKSVRLNKDGDYIIADNNLTLLWSNTIINKQDFQKFYSVTIIRNQEYSVLIIACILYIILFLWLWYISHDIEKKIKMLQSLESNTFNYNDNV